MSEILVYGFGSLIAALVLILVIAMGRIDR
jgi:hypothetical protein